MRVSESSSMSEVRAQRRAELDAPKVDTRTAILNALEQVLSEHPLHTLTVAQIIEAAGVSRGAFYSYFESKFDAAGALITSVLDAALDTWRPYLDQVDTDPLAGLESALRDSIETWAAHPGIGLTYHQYWYSVPELKAQWSTNFDRFVVRVSETIDQARAQGTIPPGTESRKLAVAGMWMTEQLVSVSITGAAEELADREFVVRAVVNMWSGLFYGDGHSG
jgi:AcrR family transcriptional regulator